ncbi:MAG: FAD/NAD(P)-binding protein [Nitrospirota bacterium]|nr:FAD/NAD(P)-binding protein [Nitrospirota bacterium]
MDTRLELVDILGEKEKTFHRRHDLSAFEFTYKAEITNIHKLTQNENLYRVQILDPEVRKQFTFLPGQFIMLELPGIGEAPFSISSSPARHGDIELCIRTAGNLTQYLSRVERGTRIGLRGPFGTCFPMEKMHGQNILLIAGGLGLAPLRAPIAYAQDNRSRFSAIDIIYGAKDPSQLLFTYQYDMWRADDINLSIIVEKPDAAWKGPVGMITKILEEMFKEREAAFFKNTYAIVCGPPVMFKFVCTLLTRKDIPMQKMFVSLERRMHCGMGKCCRCNVGSTYTCLRGPVFDYWTVMNLKEAI